MDAFRANECRSVQINVSSIIVWLLVQMIAYFDFSLKEKQQQYGGGTKIVSHALSPKTPFCLSERINFILSDF